MITQELKELVQAEATALRQHATKEERAMLNITHFKALDYQHCIYGQLTGDCYNERAVQLLDWCAKPYSLMNKWLDDSDLPATFKETGDLEDLARSGIFSPIEVYITQPGANNAALIAYLKGETDTLEL